MSLLLVTRRPISNRFSWTITTVGRQFYDRLSWGTFLTKITFSLLSVACSQKLVFLKNHFKNLKGWQTFRGHKRWHFVDIRGDISWTFFGDISWTFFGDISWTFFWWHFVDIFGDISWTFLSTKCHLVGWHFVDTFRWHFVDILDDISWTLLSD